MNVNGKHIRSIAARLLCNQQSPFWKTRRKIRIISIAAFVACLALSWITEVTSAPYLNLSVPPSTGIIFISCLCGMQTINQRASCQISPTKTQSKLRAVSTIMLSLVASAAAIAFIVLVRAQVICFALVALLLLEYGSLLIASWLVGYEVASWPASSYFSRRTRQSRSLPLLVKIGLILCGVIWAGHTIALQRNALQLSSPLALSFPNPVGIPMGVQPSITDVIHLPTITEVPKTDILCTSLGYLLILVLTVSLFSASLFSNENSSPNVGPTTAGALSFLIIGYYFTLLVSRLFFFATPSRLPGASADIICLITALLTSISNPLSSTTTASSSYEQHAAGDAHDTQQAIVGKIIVTHGLTNREAIVLMQRLTGETSSSIAATLGISPSTVRTYQARALEKINATSLEEAARLLGVTRHTHTRVSDDAVMRPLSSATRRPCVIYGALSAYLVSAGLLCEPIYFLVILPTILALLVNAPKLRETQTVPLTQKGESNAAQKNSWLPFFSLGYLIAINLIGTLEEARLTAIAVSSVNSTWFITSISACAAAAVALVSVIETLRLVVNKERSNVDTNYSDVVFDALLQTGLTPLTAQIALMIASHESSGEICRKLHVARGTVNATRYRLYQTFDIHSIQELEDKFEQIRNSSIRP